MITSHSPSVTFFRDIQVASLSFSLSLSQRRNVYSRNKLKAKRSFISDSEQQLHFNQANADPAVSSCRLHPHNRARITAECR